MELNEAITDEAYVMARLHEAIKLGAVDDALSLIAEHENDVADAKWSLIRAELDQLLNTIDRDLQNTVYEVHFADD